MTRPRDRLIELEREVQRATEIAAKFPKAWESSGRWCCHSVDFDACDVVALDVSDAQWPKLYYGQRLSSGAVVYSPGGHVFRGTDRKEMVDMLKTQEFWREK